MKKVIKFIFIMIIYVLMFWGLISGVKALMHKFNKNKCNCEPAIKVVEVIKEVPVEPTTTVATTVKTTTTTTKKQTTTSKKIVTTNKPVETDESEFKLVKTISKNDKKFIGKVTHYGPDCKGCSGTTSSGYNVNNTIYYNDKTYGNIRIVAAPKQVPLYSVLKLHNYKGGTITAIVLDRGGAITGTKFDILVSSEKEASRWGVQSNLKIEILRWGK